MIAAAVAKVARLVLHKSSPPARGPRKARAHERRRNTRAATYNTGKAGAQPRAKPFSLLFFGQNFEFTFGSHSGFGQNFAT